MFLARCFGAERIDSAHRHHSPVSAGRRRLGIVPPESAIVVWCDTVIPKTSRLRLAGHSRPVCRDAGAGCGSCRCVRRRRGDRCGYKTDGQGIRRLPPADEHSWCLPGHRQAQRRQRNPAAIEGGADLLACYAGRSKGKGILSSMASCRSQSLRFGARNPAANCFGLPRRPPDARIHHGRRWYAAGDARIAR